MLGEEKRVISWLREMLQIIQLNKKKTVFFNSSVDKLLTAIDRYYHHLQAYMHMPRKKKRLQAG